MAEVPKVSRALIEWVREQYHGDEEYGNAVDALCDLADRVIAAEENGDLSGAEYGIPHSLPSSEIAAIRALLDVEEP